VRLCHCDGDAWHLVHHVQQGKAPHLSSAIAFETARDFQATEPDYPTITTASPPTLLTVGTPTAHIHILLALSLLVKPHPPPIANIHRRRALPPYTHLPCPPKQAGQTLKGMAVPAIEPITMVVPVGLSPRNRSRR
jgi:hypothetical protein